ncbi:hypothetical protein M0802_003468 [Mischocyttarus mexicanus]|nr:hypothetical protein M0802_003468 [Mischocyttarus mexicanus]
MIGLKRGLRIPELIQASSPSYHQPTLSLTQLNIRVEIKEEEEIEEIEEEEEDKDEDDKDEEEEEEEEETGIESKRSERTVIKFATVNQVGADRCENRRGRKRAPPDEKRIDVLVSRTF